jgi:tetratricopeptide (TPR) repeat protein
MTNASTPEVARGETHVAAAVSALRALEQSPTQASIEAAMAMATEIGQALAAASVPDVVGVAAIQMVRGRIEGLRAEPLASLTSEVAVLLARSASNGDPGEHLLVEALLCAARNHRLAGRLTLARLRAGEALAVAKVRLEPGDPAIAACWSELGKACEATGDVAAARAAYRQALGAESDGNSAD